MGKSPGMFSNALTLGTFKKYMVYGGVCSNNERKSGQRVDVEMGYTDTLTIVVCYISMKVRIYFP